MRYADPFFPHACIHLYRQDPPADAFTIHDVATLILPKCIRGGAFYTQPLTNATALLATDSATNKKIIFLENTCERPERATCL